MKCDRCGTEFALERISRNRVSLATKCADCRRIRPSRPKHGHNRSNSERSPTYTTWHSMKQRCLNPNDTNYPNYGAKGIRVCGRWHDFGRFLADMGERPAGLTLDRINSNGDYEPGNCRWATMKEQCNNWGGRNLRVRYSGEEYTLQELADKLGLDRYTLRRRILDMRWPQEHWADRPSKRKRNFAQGS